MKKYILLSIFVSVVLVSVTGCESLFERQMFGMPESQWNTLTPEQQQEVIRGHNEKKSIEAQVEPLNRAASAVSGYLSNKDRSKTVTRTRYVSVPNNFYSTTTSLSSSPQPRSKTVINKTEVVNVNKTVNINDNANEDKKKRINTVTKIGYGSTARTR